MRLKHFLIAFFTLLGLAFGISSLIVQKQGFYQQDIKKIDLMPILSKAILSAEDYAILYQQTGIARPIIDELRPSPDFFDKMAAFQAHYQASVSLADESLTPVTKQEYFINSQKESVPGFEIAPYQNGYIFLTKSTFTFNWRHGHAGIVIDAKRGKTLEALSPGTISMEQDANKWRYYPTFKMLRLKDTPQMQLDEIARYASTHLRDLPYNIFADKNQGNTPVDTHCSLLVWQAFKPFGYDLDKNRELLVSPQDIAGSPLLETLQIFGFHPNKEW